MKIEYPAIRSLGRDPVRLGEASPFPIETVPMDAGWKAVFDERHSNLDVVPASMEGAIDAETRAALAGGRRRLVGGLLKFGGERVSIPAFEEDLEKLLTRGQLLSPAGLRLMRGERSQCHRNSALLWDVNRHRLFICTGYYLSSDGIWRQHSWCVENRKRRPRIVETTNPAVAYFGFAMTTAEAELFLDDNII